VSDRVINITKPKFDEEEIALVRECLESGWVTQGPLTKRFEKAFAERHKTPHALATTSCTAALHLAVMALEIKPGDEVIVPAFTWVTSAHCAEYAGAKAVFADIELETFNLDPRAFEAAITPATKAVVVVHLFGLAARMDEIMAIAKKRGIAVIEDAACATGTEYDGVPVGGFGDAGCFSFHPRKVITTGEGGMVTTGSDDIAMRVGALRNHGASSNLSWGPDSMSKPYYMANFNHLGYNLRLSDIQAAVGLAQMNKLSGLLAERRMRAERYDSLLAGIDEIAIPSVPDKCGHTYQSYVIRLRKGDMGRRNRMMEHLAGKNIQTRPGTHAVHMLGYYKGKYNIRPEAYPKAMEAEEKTITLPNFPGMTDEDQDLVISVLKDSLAL
jgi:dTDP-4-amino-4,6-dideoxygalactose transaminase